MQEFPDNENIRKSIREDANYAFGITKEKEHEMGLQFLKEFNSRRAKGEHPLEIIKGMQEKNPEYAVEEIMNTILPEWARPWAKPEYADTREGKHTTFH